MTGSTHTYRAWLIDSPDKELSVLGGSVALDAGQAPHVTATINVAMPVQSVLDQLDPRLNARIRLDVTGTFISASQTRSFDLGLRERPVTHADATVSLQLASDESLALDYARLADDWNPRTYSANLRGVVNYVLATMGGNLNANRDAYVSTAGWVTTVNGGGTATIIRGVFTGSSGTTGLRITLATSTGATAFGALSTDSEFAVTPGASYRARAEIRPSVNKTVGLRIEWRDASHAFLSSSASTTGTPGANKWAILETGPLIAPAGAAYGYLSGRITSSPVVGDIVDITGATVSMGTNAAPAQLSAVPNSDADVSPYWPLTNLVVNPDVFTTVAGYAPSTGGLTSIAWNSGSGAPSGTGFLRATQTGTTGAVYLIGAATPGIPASPGESFAAAAYVRHSVAGSSMAVSLRFLDENNAVIKTSAASPTTVDTSFVRISHIAVAPAGTTSVVPFISISATANTRTWDIDSVIVVQDTEVPPYFSGATTGSNYTYAWAGDPHASQSTRTPTVDRPRDALLWKAGQSAYDFLMPLVEASGLRLVCDEQRRWTLRDTNYTASAPTLSIREAVNMTDGTDTISRESEQAWFDAAVTEYTWTAIDGTQKRALDSYALNTPYTRCVFFERTTAYPGPGFSQYAVGRAQTRGRVVAASAVSDWTSMAEQSCSFTLAGAPVQVGKTDLVIFDLDRDEMTATARTTDIVVGAVDFLSGTVNSLSGTVDAL